LEPGKWRIARDENRLGPAMDRSIALASRFLQSRPVEHNDSAATVSDQARLLQLAGDQSDGRSSHRQHLGHEILRQGKLGIACPIQGLQQPPGQAGLQRMERIAGRSLLDLR
jgi:hypothetical protein